MIKVLIVGHGRPKMSELLNAVIELNAPIEKERITLKTQLYLIYKYNYPEDYSLVHGNTVLSAIANFSEEHGLGYMSLEEFETEYEVEHITYICGKRLDSINIE